jgi:hypothetical protein
MSLINDFKEIGAFLRKAGNIDLYNKLVDIQEKNLEVMNINNDLREEIARLKEEILIKSALKFQNDTYWLEEMDGTKKGPFCPKCYDDENKLIHLIVCPDPEYSYCPKCKLTIPMKASKVLF